MLPKFAESELSTLIERAFIEADYKGLQLCLAQARELNLDAET